MLKSASGFKHIGTDIVLFNGACDLRLDRGIASAPLRRANMIPWFGGIPRRDAPVAAPRGLSSCSAGPPLFSSAVDQQVSIFQGQNSIYTREDCCPRCSIIVSNSEPGLLVKGDPGGIWGPLTCPWCPFLVDNIIVHPFGEQFWTTLFPSLWTTLLSFHVDNKNVLQ